MFYCSMVLVKDYAMDVIHYGQAILIRSHLVFYYDFSIYDLFVDVKAKIVGSQKVVIQNNTPCVIVFFTFSLNDYIDLEKVVVFGHLFNFNVAFIVANYRTAYDGLTEETDVLLGLTQQIHINTKEIDNTLIKINCHYYLVNTVDFNVFIIYFITIFSLSSYCMVFYPVIAKGCGLNYSYLTMEVKTHIHHIIYDDNKDIVNIVGDNDSASNLRGSNSWFVLVHILFHRHNDDLYNLVFTLKKNLVQLTA